MNDTIKQEVATLPCPNARCHELRKECPTCWGVGTVTEAEWMEWANHELDVPGLMQAVDQFLNAFSGLCDAMQPIQRLKKQDKWPSKEEK